MTQLDDTLPDTGGPDDPDLIAAEYVLGTLDAAERAAIQARRSQDVALDVAITAWEFRLAPLLLATPDVPPPSQILPRLLQDLLSRTSPVRLVASSERASSDRSGGQVVNFEANTTVALRRRVRTWQWATGLTSALAASLAIGLGLVESAHLGTLPASVAARIPARLVSYLPTAPAAAQNFVAVLQKDAASPAFIVSVDLTTKSLTVRPVSPQPQTDKAYQLWLVDASLGAPKSLGLIGDKPYTTSQNLPYGKAIVQNATYAVSIEPPGGSPTGAPTGPVVYAGKLIQTTP